jgi:SRSO17 transposase
LLSRAKWDADALRDDLITLVKERLGDPQAVLVLDETGLLKQGTMSVGVGPQDSGTAGKSANCQIGVFAASASRQGQVLVDRALYLPQDWTLNQRRCQEAGVPEQVGCATKLELARRMVERVIAAKVPVAWVTGDSISGADAQLRHWLAEQRIPSVLAVACNHLVRTSWRRGRQSLRVDQFLPQPQRLRWSRLSAGPGAKGPRLYDGAWRALEDVGPAGWATWIVARRSLADAREMAYSHVCARHPNDLGADRPGSRSALAGRGSH